MFVVCLLGKFPIDWYLRSRKIFFVIFCYFNELSTIFFLSAPSENKLQKLFKAWVVTPENTKVEFRAQTKEKIPLFFLSKFAIVQTKLFVQIVWKVISTKLLGELILRKKSWRNIIWHFSVQFISEKRHKQLHNGRWNWPPQNASGI